MPKLPDSLALGERPRPEPLGRGFQLAEAHDYSGRGLDKAGAEISGAGDAIFKMEEELRRSRQASNLSDVLGKASTELGEQTLKFQRDQDYKTSPTRFKDAADEIGQRYLGSFSTPIEQEAFKREYGRLALSHHLNVLSNAAKQEGDANVAQLDSNLDVYAKSAANAQNPLERETVVNQARLAIAGQRRAGWITDVDAEKRTHVFESKLEHASVLRDIGVDPKTTAEKLATDPAYASNLDPLSRQQLQHTALVREQQNKSQVQPIEARQDAEKAMTPSAPSAVGFQQTSTAGDGTQPTSQRMTATDVRAQLPKWISNAEAEAEKRHPGDPVYRDLVVGRVKNYVSTVVAAQEGEQRQAYTGLIGVLAGVAGTGKKPITQDELFATPGAREAYAKLEPQQQAAVLTHLNHNANEAIGKPAQLNARLVNQIFPRLFLDPSDPKAIYQPQQLAQFVPQGLTPEGHSVLARKIEELKNPDGKGFSASVERVNRTAHAMLTRSIMGSVQPDVAEEAALTFRNDLDKKIEQYRKDGTDLQGLLTKGSPDYVLAPERVASYMSSGKQAVYDASKTVTGEIPPVSQMEKLDVANPQKSFDALKPGAWFVAPDGRVGRKPGEVAQPAAAAPKAPLYESFVERQTEPHRSGYFRVNAPARSPAQALAGNKYETKEQAIEALRALYEGAK